MTQKEEALYERPTFIHAGRFCHEQLIERPLGHLMPKINNLQLFSCLFVTTLIVFCFSD